MLPRSVLVTGASSGFGRALVLEYASLGCKIALCARRADRLADVADEVRRRGGIGICLPLDVTDASAVASAVSRAAPGTGQPRHGSGQCRMRWNSGRFPSYL